MLLSASILIFQFSPFCEMGPFLSDKSCWSQHKCRRAGVLLFSSRDNGQSTPWTNPAGSAEALQSSLCWHLLSWSTQGPQEAAAKWAVIHSMMYLLQGGLQAAGKKDCPWPDGRPGTCLCLPGELERSHPSLI